MSLKNNRAAEVLIGAGVLQKLPGILKSFGDSKPVLIADKNVSKLHAGRVLELLKRNSQDARSIEIPSGESSKNLRVAEFLYAGLAQYKARRSTPILALGGGVTSDLVGFVASTYMRGLPLILLPTTLLAQADAAIGGKTGINLKAGKNLVGTFYPAACTIVDFDFLKTLPARESRNGFAEIIKMCILEGEKAFRELEEFSEDCFNMERAKFPECELGVISERIKACSCVVRFNNSESPLFQSLLERSISAKVALVKRDPKETTGQRAVLNLGHTFAHGLEAATGYKAYTHGEAVAVGLVAACKLAELENGFSFKLTDRIQSAIAKFGLPVQYWKTTPEKIYSCMAVDKKRTETLRFVLPLKLGKVELRANIPDHLVLEVLKQMRGKR